MAQDGILEIETKIIVPKEWQNFIEDNHLTNQIKSAMRLWNDLTGSLENFLFSYENTLTTLMIYPNEKVWVFAKVVEINYGILYSEAIDPLKILNDDFGENDLESNYIQPWRFFYIVVLPIQWHHVHRLEEKINLVFESHGEEIRNNTKFLSLDGTIARLIYDDIELTYLFVPMYPPELRDNDIILYVNEEEEEEDSGVESDNPMEE
ncbi:hypothetical protein evm_012239 [Chilo suppressalis]|nr:hypothetical protein evm_012239 [Chilo suppressalis]